MLHWFWAYVAIIVSALIGVFMITIPREILLNKLDHTIETVRQWMFTMHMLRILENGSAIVSYMMHMPKDMGERQCYYELYHAYAKDIGERQCYYELYHAYA